MHKGAMLAALESAREDLLDLSFRNKLLHTSRSSRPARAIEIVDEVSEEVFRILVEEHKTMRFKASEKKKGAPDDPGGDVHAYVPPDDDAVDAGVVPLRHKDTLLQTSLDKEALQAKISSIARNARTVEEEQGVNTLFLVLGFLKYFGDENSRITRYAPLLLIPVELPRTDIRKQFRLKARDDDLVTNLSLQKKLKMDFGIGLPSIPEDEKLSVKTYFDEVRDAISDKSLWKIEENSMVLGFFSFSKLLMYQDLDLQKSPDALDNKNLSCLLGGENFEREPPVIPEGDRLDKHLDLASLAHVLDADSSQARVIAATEADRNLVVQGPPGTGKSQTIVNLIAGAVHQGKKVIFLAEKMAALDVVHRRLKSVGLSDICLELHSRKASKKLVIEELGRTLGRRHTGGINLDESRDDLRGLRDVLNTRDEKMHTPLNRSGLTPFRVMGEMIKLRTRGIRAPDFEMPESAKWPQDQARRVYEAVDKFAEQIKKAGVLDRHPWRGVQRDDLQPTDIDRLMPKIKEAQEQGKKMASIIETARNLIDDGIKIKLSETVNFIDILKLLSQRPNAPIDVYVQLFGEKSKFNAVRKLVKDGQRFSEIHSRMLGRVGSPALGMDLSSTRAAIDAYGDRWFRHVKSEFRQALATLRKICIPPCPTRRTECLQLINEIMEWQEAHVLLLDNAVSGKEVFGPLWNGRSSDFNALMAIVQWCREVLKIDFEFNLPQAAASNVDFKEAHHVADEMESGYEEFARSIKELEDELRIDPHMAFDVDALQNVAYGDWISRLEDWMQARERLPEWDELRSAYEDAMQSGANEVANRLRGDRITPEDAKDAVRYAHYEAVWKSAISKDPGLKSADGDKCENSIRKFQQRDSEHIENTAHDILTGHLKKINEGDSHPGLDVIRREIGKKRRHLSIRKLIQRAGPALQEIKPVFMMSPLSVAQFLPFAEINFDLLIIDEASQVKPADALGAIARAKQIVVVGDDKQLPPTSFFDRLMHDDDSGGDNDGDDDDSSEIRTGEMESILKLCVSRGIPGETLRWHYRSRHPSLIHVSNKQFYDWGLFLPPSPVEDRDNLGLSFKGVDGIYESGSARNCKEANIVVQAVMDHARAQPEKTLLVATFSASQREFIWNELEFARGQSPELEPFFSLDKNEPFDVKNLENVQGDERDVVFVSVGYGPTTPGGSVPARFGPVSQDGGERRLNVLFTRARERCVIFSSMKWDQIDASRALHKGPGILKEFLRYADTGQLDTTTTTGRDFDSPFEEAVAGVIKDLGYDIEPQVGSEGFFIDIGVKHPGAPGRFMLGVECDGASYHSALWARDRDRLRQSILEGQGWRIYRIWSTDWFYRLEDQKQKLEEALREACAKDS